jgi:chromosome segregation ATPase
MASQTNGGDVVALYPESIRAVVRAVVRAWGQTTSTPDEDGLHRIARMASEAAIAHVGGELAKVRITAANWEIAYDKAMRERDTYAGQAHAYVQACNQMDREIATLKRDLERVSRERDEAERRRRSANDRARTAETHEAQLHSDLEAARNTALRPQASKGGR